MNIDKYILYNNKILNKFNKYDTIISNISNCNNYDKIDDNIIKLLNNKKKIKHNCNIISTNIDNFLYKKNDVNNINNYDIIYNSLLNIKNDINDLDIHICDNKYIKIIHREHWDIIRDIKKGADVIKNSVEDLGNFLLKGIIDFIKNIVGNIGNSITQGISFIGKLILDIFKPIISVFDKIFNFLNKTSKKVIDIFNTVSKKIFSIIKYIYKLIINKIIPLLKKILFFLIKFVPYIYTEIYKLLSIFIINIKKVYIISPLILFLMVILFQKYLKILSDHDNILDPYIIYIISIVIICFLIIFKCNTLLFYQSFIINKLLFILSNDKIKKYINIPRNNNNNNNEILLFILYNNPKILFILLFILVFLRLIIYTLIKKYIYKKIL